MYQKLPIKDSRSKPLRESLITFEKRLFVNATRLLHNSSIKDNFLVSWTWYSVSSCSSAVQMYFVGIFKISDIFFKDDTLFSEFKDFLWLIKHFKALNSFKPAASNSFRWIRCGSFHLPALMHSSSNPVQHVCIQTCINAVCIQNILHVQNSWAPSWDWCVFVCVCLQAFQLTLSRATEIASRNSLKSMHFTHMQKTSQSQFLCALWLAVTQRTGFLYRAEWIFKPFCSVCHSHSPSVPLFFFIHHISFLVSGWRVSSIAPVICSISRGWFRSHSCLRWGRPSLSLHFTRFKHTSAPRCPMTVFQVSGI